MRLAVVCIYNDQRVESSVAPGSRRVLDVFDSHDEAASEDDSKKIPC